MGRSRKPFDLLGLGGLGVLLLALAGGSVMIGSPREAAADGEGWLGVSLQELTPRLREAMDLGSDLRGAVVARVLPGSPAERDGLREGDVIVEVNDRSVRSVDDVVELVRDLDPGEKTLVVVNRDGRERGISVTLGERGDAEFGAPRGRVSGEVRKHFGREAPKADESDSPEPRRNRYPFGDDENEGDKTWTDDGDKSRDDRWLKKDDDGNVRFKHKGPRHRVTIAPRVRIGGGDGGYLGVNTLPLGDQLAQYFKVEDGVLVTEVVEDSPAAKAGLLAGDVIVAVNGESIDSPRELRREIRDLEPEETVELTVMRKGERRSLKATLGRAKDFGNVFYFSPDDHFVGMPDLPDLPEIPGVPEIEALHDFHFDMENLPDMEFEWNGLSDEGREALEQRLEGLRDHLKGLKIQFQGRDGELHRLHEKLRQNHDVLREIQDRRHATEDLRRIQI